MRSRLSVRLGAAAASVAVAAALGVSLSVAGVTGAGASGGTPVAIPTGGPPVDCPGCPPGSMIVLNYYNSGGSLVGQKWWGCEGQVPGSWGVTTSIHNAHFVPC